MTSWHGMIFKNIDSFWINLRLFAYRNRTVLEIIFVLAYAFEQAFLVWYTFQAKSLNELSYIISIFAIIVLTTFSLHKLVMESRIKKLEEEIDLLRNKKSLLEQNTLEAEKEYNYLQCKIDSLVSKNLNRERHSFSKRG